MGGSKKERERGTTGSQGREGGRKEGRQGREGGKELSEQSIEWRKAKPQTREKPKTLNPKP